MGPDCSGINALGDEKAKGKGKGKTFSEGAGKGFCFNCGGLSLDATMPLSKWQEQETIRVRRQEGVSAT